MADHHDDTAVDCVEAVVTGVPTDEKLRLLCADIRATKGNTRMFPLYREEMAIVAALLNDELVRRTMARCHRVGEGSDADNSALVSALREMLISKEDRAKFYDHWKFRQHIDGCVGGGDQSCKCKSTPTHCNLEGVLDELEAGLYAEGNAIERAIAALTAPQQSEPAAVEPVKRWPFVESPGEFADRLTVALNAFDGYVLGAVRNVLIENPPALTAPRESDAAKRLVDEQAEDDGLWFEAVTITETYLQTALRKLHAAVEAEAPRESDAVMNQRMYIENVENILRRCQHSGDWSEASMYIRLRDIPKSAEASQGSKT